MKTIKIGSRVITKVGKDVDGVYIPKYSTGFIIDTLHDHGILYLLIEFDDIGRDIEDECTTEWYSKNQLKAL